MLVGEPQKRLHLRLPMLSSSFIWQQTGKQCKEGCSHSSGAFYTPNSQQQPVLQFRSCTVLTPLANSDWGRWAYRRSWHSLNMIKKSPQQGSHLSEKGKRLLQVTIDTYGRIRWKAHCIFLMESMKQRLFILGAGML